MVYGSTKSRFIKEQEAIGILSSLGLRTLFSEIPLVQRYKKNEIVDTFLLAGDKFMPEMHLRQLRFIYSA